MDITDHFGKIVESLVNEISSNVKAKVDDIINVSIAEKLSTFKFEDFIQSAATAAMEKKIAEYTIDQKKLENRIVGRINEVIKEAETKTNLEIDEAVKNRVSGSNFNEVLTSSLSRIISDRISEFVFPDNSIPASSLKFDNYKISGNHIQGGIISSFSSVGIDDRATQIALTILDEVTVVENNLITKDLTIEGAMTVNGEFVVNGQVPKDSAFFNQLVNDSADAAIDKIDSNLFENYSRIIFNQIRTEGLDLNKITLNNNEVIKDNTLGPSIINSNLQKLGTLRELQVSGESIIAESFYVTKGRVGINTIEPSAALSIWDDEIEITASKRQKDMGSFGTPRPQQLTLFANNKNNIILETDGSVQINDLKIGQMRFTSADRPPSYVSERNHIVWNTNPNPGGPLGWVCLGGANWANFGIID
jgi:hypothetical protein